MVAIPYVAISVKDYENLAKNFAELRRYIEQQKPTILYYEKAVQSDPADDTSSSCPRLDCNVKSIRLRVY